MTQKRGEDEDILKVLCEIDVRIHSGMNIWLCFAAFAGFIAPLFSRRFLSEYRVHLTEINHYKIFS